MTGFGDAIAARLTLDASQAIDSVVGFVGSVRDAVAEVVELAETQARAEEAFTRIAKLRKQNTAGLLDEQQRFNASLQLFTGIGDEVLLSLQRQALAMNVQRSELSKVTLAAVGMAEVHDIGLSEAIRKASLVAQGEVEQLQELGQQFTNSSDAIDFYANASEIATDRTERLTGAQASLDASFGDLLETIGSVVNESEPLVANTRELDQWIRELNDSLIESKPALQNFFDEAVRLTKDWGAELATAALLLNPITAGVGLTAAVGIGATSGDDDGASDFVGPRVEDIGGDRELARRELQQAKQQEVADRKSRQARERAARQRAQEEKKREREEARKDREEEQRRQRLLQGERAYEDQRLKLQIETNRIRFAQEEQAYFERKKAQEERQAQFQMVEMAFAQALADGVAGSIDAIVMSAVTGEQDVLSAVGGLVGGILSNIGTMLIQLGTAGILAGTLGTVIPALAGLTGGALGIAAGAAAVAGGIAMKVLGASLGGASSDSGGGASARATGGGMTAAAAGDTRNLGGDEAFFLDRRRAQAASGGARDSSSGGGLGSGESAPITNVYQISFKGAAVSRSEAGLARDLGHLNRLDDRLSGRRTLPGAA